MKKKPLWLLLPALPVLLWLLGYSRLSPIPKVSAKGHLRPVVAAISKFKARTGNLPTTLQELQASAGNRLKLEEGDGYFLRWSIRYERINPDSYWVEFNHAHYDLRIKDGRVESWRFNPFR